MEHDMATGTYAYMTYMRLDPTPLFREASWNTVPEAPCPRVQKSNVCGKNSEPNLEPSTLNRVSEAGFSVQGLGSRAWVLWLG